MSWMDDIYEKANRLEEENAKLRAEITNAKKDDAMKTSSPHAVTRIRKVDLDWLQNRAEKHHRTPPEEIAAVRELVDLLEESRGDYDVLPHPEGGRPVPVVTPLKVTSRDH